LGYQRVLENPEVWIGYANTILYTVGGTILNVVLTAMAGYALSRRDLIGRSRLALILIITMYFSGGMIPNYLNMRDFHLTNTRLSMMIVGLVGVSNVLVTRNFFRSSVPWTLQEAAFLDGASDFQVFTQVILPLSKPILALITINYAVTHWNDYMNARIYLRDKSMYPLQMVLRDILLDTDIESLGTGTENAETILSQILEQKSADQIKYALIVVATVPMLAVYPFLEKHFSRARGQMVGGVKG
jgi:putative aldouronate transport system permease protein